MTFKTALKSLRTGRGLTQEQLSALTGISKSAISMYENGKRFPDEPTLELLADFFNVDMNTLLGKQEGTTYYADPETAALAQELKENPQYKVLLDATKNLKPESVKEIMRFIDYQKSKEEGSAD